MAQTARSNEAERAADNVAAISSRIADKAADATREATDRTRDAARRGLEQVQRTAGAFDWDKAARIQADLLRASLKRSAEFTRRYFEVVQAVTASRR